MLSGMLAGEAVVDKLLADSKPSGNFNLIFIEMFEINFNFNLILIILGAVELDNYSAKMLSSDAVAELKAVRNVSIL